MLIQFALENWYSFRERTQISMIAGEDRIHSETLAKLCAYQTNILPIAAFFGGNASGKTNLVIALSFARRMVVQGLKPEVRIPREPFLLNDLTRQAPSSFAFEILVEETIYEYSFAVDDHIVKSERLIRIDKSEEKVLFDRHPDSINLGDSLPNTEYLNYAFRGTRDNQLFLTNSVSQKVEDFKPVHDWFRETLVLVPPDASFKPVEPFFAETHPLHGRFSDLLHQLDTGITRIGSIQVPLGNLPMPEELKAEVIEDLTEDSTALVNSEFAFSLQEGEVVVKRLSTYHQGNEGSEVRFAIPLESDGTKRLIDLLPAFLDVASGSNSKVYVVDELDRSLHTTLVRQLIEAYLSVTSHDTRTQLIFTTHNLMLMDQNLLRKDEMWLAERNIDGNSTLSSIADFGEMRDDTDVRQMYLQGSTGGLPQIWIDGDDFR